MPGRRSFAYFALHDEIDVALADHCRDKRRMLRNIKEFCRQRRQAPAHVGQRFRVSRAEAVCVRRRDLNRARPAAFDARGINITSAGNTAVTKYAAMIPGVTTANRQVLILANTNTYGGIGGTLATTSGGAPQGPLISPHELGHSLGGLQGRVPLLGPQRPGPALHRRRAELGPPHQVHDPGDAGRALEVVALAR